MLLEVRDIEVRYQKTAALRGVSMAVPAGGIVTIIGANGAGKTTALRAISGLEPLTRGEIRFDDTKIDGLAPEEIVRRGIAHVPEGRRVFPDLTVEENLHTGAFLRADKVAIRASLDEVFGHFPRLAERRRQWARSMSGGEQQMLAIGRALMSAPRVLLLDEPSMGLSPVMVQEIARIVADISGRGVRSCWSSRTRKWRSGSRGMPMCSKPGRWRWKARRPTCARTPMSAAPISADSAGARV